MAGLTELRDAAAAHLCGVLPDMRIEGISGTGEAALIFGQAIGRGAIFIMVLDAVNAAPADSLVFDADASLAALVVVHGGKDRTKREDAGLPLAEKAALAIHGQTFGLTGAMPARVTGLAPIDDEELDRRGLWAWGITWQQRTVF